MKIYLLGVEQPTNLRLTGDYPHVGTSYASLRKRLPKKKAWTIRDRFPGKQMYLSLGGPAVAKMSDAEINEYADEAEAFVREHGNDFDMVVGVDDHRVSVARLNHLPNYAPVWYAAMGVGQLQKMAEIYDTVALRAEDVRASPMLMSQVVTLRARHKTNWHLLDGARLEDLMTGKYQSAATIAWLSPMKNGETIVWDGVRMQRYPSRMKATARMRHRTLFARAGFDPDLIADPSNYDEITRFTVWSFAQMESHVDRKKPTTNPFTVLPGGGESEVVNTEDAEIEEGAPGTDVETVDNSAVEVRNAATPPARRTGPPQVMPGFDFERRVDVEISPTGERVEVERLLAKKGSVPLRQCDTCHVQANCPAFQPAAECAYSLPIEIKTKEQLTAALAAFLEKQMDRVAFMLMQEDLNGGYADPNTSQEMDRLYEMVKKTKEINDNREYFKVQVEARAQGGVMSRLFGEQAKRLGDLPLAIEGDIVEAEILGD